MLRCHVCTAVHILLAINCFYICCVYKVDVIVISALTIKVSVKLIKDLLLLLLLFILISLRKMIIFLSLRRPRTKFSDTSMFLNRYGNNTTTFHHFNPVNLQFLFPFIRGSLHHIPQIIFAYDFQLLAEHRKQKMVTSSPAGDIFINMYQIPPKEVHLLTLSGTWGTEQSRKGTHSV